MDVDVSDSGSRQWVPSMPMSRQQDTSFSLAWLLRAPTAATSLSETMEVSNNWPGTVSQTESLNYMEQVPSSLVCLEAQKGGSTFASSVYIIVRTTSNYYKVEDARIKGIQASGRKYFYVRMIFSAWFLIQHPLPKLFLIQLKHSQISSYKIIWNKSEVMPVCHSAMVGGCQFQWIIILYLGVKLCADMADIIHINMVPLLTKTKQ